MWDWLQGILRIIQLQLQPSYVRNRLRAPRLRIVVLGGSHIDYAIVQSRWLDVARWFRDKASVVWRVEWEHRPDDTPGERELREYQLARGDPWPTLYVATYVDRFEGDARGAWAGQYGYVKSDPNQALLAHELGHALGLKHTSGAFMSPGTEGRRLRRATQEQVEVMRREALLYE